MIFFVLHGFASATPNDKSNHFESIFPKDTVVNLNYDFDPDIGKNQLFDQIDAVLSHYKDPELTFVGTSLGGFYAQFLAYTYGAKAIAINPAVVPSNTLTQYVGKNKNFSTGKEFDFTLDMARKYSAMDINPGLVPTLVLLDMGDDVIDAAETVKHFAGKASIKTYEGGSHRFDHLVSATPCIVEFANDIIYY